MASSISRLRLSFASLLPLVLAAGLLLFNAPGRSQEEDDKPSILSWPPVAEGEAASWQVAGLQAALTGPAVEVREEAVRIAVSLRLGANVDPAFAVSLLAHKDVKIRGAAALALGQMKDKGAPYAEKIAALLQDSEVVVRCLAAEALGSLGAAGAPFASQLRPLMGSGDEAQSQAASGALGAMGKESVAVAELTARLLKRGDAATQASAVRALGHMGAHAAPFLSRIPPLLREEKQRDAAIDALDALGEDGAAGGLAGQIAPMLKDRDAEVRSAAIEGLGALGSAASSFAGEVAAFLKDADPEVRSQAVSALGQMGKAGAAFSAQALPLLTEAKSNSEPGRSVRYEAATALGEFSKEDGAFVEKLAPLLTDADPEMRAAAVRGLGAARKFAAPHVAEIASLLDDGAPEVRMEAAATLGEIGEAVEPFAPRLLALLGDARIMARRNAVTALEKMRKQAARLSPQALGYVFVKDDESPLPAVWVIDEMGIPTADEKERAGWLSTALAFLWSRETQEHPALRAHLRLWCGGDERLQRALDWLGAPSVAPKAAELSAGQLRDLLATFSDLWPAAEPVAATARADSAKPAATEDMPLMLSRDPVRKELAGRIEQHAGAITVAPEADLVAVLQKLHGQCEANEGARKAIEHALSLVRKAEN